MRYEYKIVRFEEKGFVNSKVKWQALEDRLNELGKEGWDIEDVQPAAFGGGESGVIVFLKRAGS